MRAGMTLNTMAAFSGPMQQKLLNNNMDVGVLRPYFDNIGTSKKPDIRAFVDLIDGYVRDPETNAVVPKFRKVEVENAVLRKDEWIAFDAAVVKEARQRLVFVDMLLRRGLTFNVDGMSKTSLETENLNDMQPAELTMDGVNRAKKDKANFELVGVPLPIQHKEFDISLRTLNSSRNQGESLDVTQAEQAGRQIAELIETIHVTGASTYKAAGYILYGVADQPNINTGSLTANWDDSAASGTTILADVISMMTALRTDRFYGPYALLVPANFEGSLDEDFKANSDKTVRQRLMEIDSIEEILVVDKLTSDNVIMLQLSSDVVRVINGLAPTTIQWESVGGLLLDFKAMAIMVPQVRATQALRSGIVKFT